MVIEDAFSNSALNNHSSVLDLLNRLTRGEVRSEMSNPIAKPPMEAFSVEDIVEAAKMSKEPSTQFISIFWCRLAALADSAVIVDLHHQPTCGVVGIFASLLQVAYLKGTVLERIILLHPQNLL